MGRNTNSNITASMAWVRGSTKRKADTRRLSITAGRCRTVVTDALDVKETSIGCKADLFEIFEILQT